MIRIAALTLAALLPIGALAQTPATIAPPTSGMLVTYQYWPTQYVQFVTGNELPYSMFELDVDSSGKQQVLHAVLTGKDGTRTHYSNVDALVTAYKAQGEASYKTTFAFEGDETEKVGAASTVRFTGHDEKPVEFRFVQGSDISAQGSGLTALPKAPVPVFAYREIGAVAGEGTALKIGETASPAEVWTEISHPPYFVGYRGGLTQSAHLVVLAKGSESWKIAKSPAALTAGSAWEMDNERGDHRVLKIDKVDGAKFLLSATDRFHPSVRMALEATRAGDGWSVERVRYMPATKDGEKHAVTFTFAPALSSTATAGTMEMSVGKKAKIATASVTLSGDAADRTESLKITAPAWAVGKELSEETKVTADAVSITAK